MTNEIATAEFSLEMPDGTVLTACTDLGLASKWARRQVGEAWNQLNRTGQAEHVAAARTEVCRIYQEAHQ